MLFLLAATVPWFAGGKLDSRTGLPGWVLYSLLGTLVLVVLLELLIQFFWDREEGGQNGE